MHKLKPYSHAYHCSCKLANVQSAGCSHYASNPTISTDVLKAVHRSGRSMNLTSD